MIGRPDCSSSLVRPKLRYRSRYNAVMSGLAGFPPLLAAQPLRRFGHGTVPSLTSVRGAWLIRGPADEAGALPAGCSSSGTRLLDHAAMIGVTMRHDSSASSPRMDSAGSRLSTSSSSWPYGGSSGGGRLADRLSGASLSTWAPIPVSSRVTLSG